MGAWGTAIFSDDLAADVRDDFRDLIGEGHTPAEATSILCDEYRDSIADHDEGNVFWLALAATQWKLGRLEESVKTAALNIIDSGKELDRWRDDTKLMQKRAAVLTTLRQQLLSQQPEPKKVPKIIKHTNDWEVGEIVSYTLQSGLKICFRVIGHHTDKGGRAPVCELLDWVGKAPPTQSELSQLPIRKGKKVRSISQFLLTVPDTVKKGANRFERLFISTTPFQKPGGYTGFPWQYLDRMLKEHFDLD